MTDYYLFPIYLIIPCILLYLLLRLNKKYIQLIDKNIELKDVLSTSSCSIIISDNKNRIVKTINIKDDIFNDLDKNNFIIDFYRKVSEGDSKYKSINNHIILNTRNLYTPGMDSQNEFEICHNGKSKWINLKSVRIDGNRIISYLKDNTFDVETNKKIISSKSF